MNEWGKLQLLTMEVMLGMKRKKGYKGGDVQERYPKINASWFPLVLKN